ncbi:Hypothetical predicted protein, partial [Paramuricea clavata]
MQLLEKDIHDKQDTLISLRRQLQDIKTINLDLHTKWQESQAANAQHVDKWGELEEKCSRMINDSKDMEN